MLYYYRLISTCVCTFFICSGIVCQGQASVRLITLDPGHFHAALVQKSMYAGVDSLVYVSAPPGPDVESHLDKIKTYNTPQKHPTHSSDKLYTRNDLRQPTRTANPANPSAHARHH